MYKKRLVLITVAIASMAGVSGAARLLEMRCHTTCYELSVAQYDDMWAALQFIKTEWVQGPDGEWYDCNLAYDFIVEAILTGDSGMIGGSTDTTDYGGHHSAHTGPDSYITDKTWVMGSNLTLAEILVHEAGHHFCDFPDYNGPITAYDPTVFVTASESNMTHGE